ncbi:MAG: allantoinase AllB [Deltaproteobacteria bacterium]|nr:allantoinase AllB [Deltaproteobacteria bacterium]
MADSLPIGLRSRRVLTADGPRDAVVELLDGRITAVHDPEDAPPQLATEDLGELVLMAGLVDTHVHINDPGRTAWEGFATATRAAAAGGVTTLVDMPLNSSPVTTTRSALDAKLRTATDEPLTVDVGFWGGAVPGNSEQLGDLARGGVLGAKAFLCHSGIDEFPASDEESLVASGRALSNHDRPLLLHAELERESDLDRAALAELPLDDYRIWLESRPPSFEEAAVLRAIDVARRTGSRVHVVHLSAGSAVPLLRRAKEEGLPVTVETCPHYLVLTAEEVGAGQTQFKCAPPIREASNRDLLWDGLRDGTIDFIVSDHSPCTADLKCGDTGDFGAAWGGIATLGLTLPVVWTEARRRGFGLDDVARWLGAGPAAFAGLSDRGTLRAGARADLVAWDPDASWVCTPSAAEFRNKVSPWFGRSLQGRTVTTWLGGSRIWHDGAAVGAPQGIALLET